MGAPGVAPNPPVPDGERDLQQLQAGGFTAEKILAYKAQTTSQLREGGFNQQQVDDYWGDSKSVAPNTDAAIASNLQRAGARDGGIEAALKDPVSFLATTLNMSWHDWHEQLKVDQAKAKGTADAANQQFELAAPHAGSLDPGDAVSYAIHTGAGFADLGSAAWQYLLSGGTALVNMGPDKLTQQIPIPEFGPANYRMGGKLPAGFTGDVVSNAAGFMIGGDHAIPKASIPEPIRWASIDDTNGVIHENPGGIDAYREARRAGRPPGLRGGPQEVVDHAAGPAANTSLAPVKAMIPSASDFVDHAADIVGDPKNTEAIQRVQKNLQDIYAATGFTPDAAVARAKVNPVFREELLGQDVNGDVVSPHYGASRPGTPTPLAPVEHSVDGFENSVGTSMAIMQSLEGSGVHAVSVKGAVGRFQIMPGTAEQYGFDASRLQDPAYNAIVARTIITDLYNRFHGNLEAMAIAYNGGPGRANRWMNAGAGTRLVAIRDNSMRTGWRYVQEATDRDESFLPAETQMYVARARYKMGKPESEPAEGGWTGGTQHMSPDEIAAMDNEGTRGIGDNMPPPETEAGGGGGRATSGGAAARSWEEATDDELFSEMASNVGEQPQGKLFSSWDAMVSRYVSELRPARVLDNALEKADLLDRDKEAGVEAVFRQVYRSPVRASVAVRYGVIDGPATKNVIPDSPSIFKAFQEVKKAGGDPDEFRYFLIAQRVMDLEARGITSGFNPEAAAQMVSRPDIVAKYEAGAQIFHDATDGMLDYLQKAGRYSQAQVDAMRALGPHYVSFARLMGDNSKEFQMSGRDFVVGNPLKRMEGSNRQISDPILATIDNFHRAFHSADVNYAVGHLIGLAEKNPDIAAQLGLEQVDGVSHIDLDAVTETLKKYGFSEEEMPRAQEAYGELIQDRLNKDLGPNEFTYYRDGQREVWKIDSPEFAQLLKGSTEKIQTDIITKIVHGFASVVRAGVALPTDFALRSTFSHQVIQFINHPNHPPPFLTGAMGLVDAMGMTDLMKDAMAKGALGTSLTEMGRDFMAKDMDELLTGTGVFDRVRNVVGDPKAAVMAPLQLARAVQERLDMANRVSLLKQGIDSGLSWEKSADLAAKHGIDYSERGASALLNWWAGAVPFFRPHLLYLKDAAEAWATRPVSTAAYATLAVTLPQMILTGLSLMQDPFLPEDRRYKEIPTWEKLYYYITPEIGGQRIKLRLPAAVGFPMGAVPAAIMETIFDHHPVKAADLMRGFIQAYCPPMLPAIVQPPAEVIANKSALTGKPLVPDSLKDALPELQYTPNTSPPAKALAKVLGPSLRKAGFDTLSPIAMDHLVDGWTGAAGQYALSAVGAVAGQPGAPSDVSNIPIVRGMFLQHPGMNAQSIQDFFDEKSKFDTMVASKTGIKHEIRQGDLDNMNLAPKVWAYARAGQRMNNVSQALAMMRASVWGIYRNKEMSGAEKLQHVRNITTQMIDLSRSATKVMRDFEDKAGQP